MPDLPRGSAVAKGRKTKAGRLAFIKQEAAHSYAHTQGIRHSESLGTDLSVYNQLWRMPYSAT